MHFVFPYGVYLIVGVVGLYQFVVGKNQVGQISRRIPFNLLYPPIKSNHIPFILGKSH